MTHRFPYKKIKYYDGTFFDKIWLELILNESLHHHVLKIYKT